MTLNTGWEQACAVAIKCCGLVKKRCTSTRYVLCFVPDLKFSLHILIRFYIVSQKNLITISENFLWWSESVYSELFRCCKILFTGLSSFFFGQSDFSSVSGYESNLNEKKNNLNCYVLSFFIYTVSQLALINWQGRLEVGTLNRNWLPLDVVFRR